MTSVFLASLLCITYFPVVCETNCNFGSQANVIRCAEPLVRLVEVNVNAIRPSFVDINTSCESFHKYLQCASNVTDSCRKTIMGQIDSMYELICDVYKANISSEMSCYKKLESQQSIIDCVSGWATQNVMSNLTQVHCSLLEGYLDCIITDDFIEECTNAVKIEFLLLSEFANRSDNGCSFNSVKYFFAHHIVGEVPECNTNGTCSCSTGYILNETSYHCEDIDECELGIHNCSQKCHNTKGSYRCTCHSEYFKLASDQRSCKRLDSEEPWLFFAYGQSIWNMSMNGEEIYLQKSGLQKVAMIDLYIKEKKLYYADVQPNILEVTSLDGIYSRQLQTFEVDGLEGIAVDWIGKNLYSLRRTDLFVQTLDGLFRKILYRKIFRLPRALVVYPQKGKLYASDWSSSAFIACLNMDGTKWQKIITAGIIWPNALTIDIFSERIFWADAFLDTIQSADLDGKRRRTVVEGSNSVPHVFSLAVFDDHLYWTDWTYRGVLKANKLNGQNFTILERTTLLPYSIKVFHSFLQTEDKKNACDAAGCSQLCLISGGKKVKCECGDGYFLEKDGHSCKSKCSDKEIVCDGSESKCVSKMYRCDGIMQCKDQSDEQNCTFRICPPGHFQCQTTKDCKMPSAICDGKRQCVDGSDERYCQ